MPLGNRSDLDCIRILVECTQDAFRQTAAARAHTDRAGWTWQGGPYPWLLCRHPAHLLKRLVALLSVAGLAGRDAVVPGEAPPFTHRHDVVYCQHGRCATVPGHARTAQRVALCAALPGSISP